MRQPNYDYVQQWESLVSACSTVTANLFSVKDGAREAAASAKQMISLSEPKETLRVFSTGVVHVPWSFCLDHEERIPSPANGTITDFDQFWGSRFNVVTRFDSGDYLECATRSKANFRLLHALDKNLFNRAKSTLPTQLQTSLDDLVTYEVGNVTDWISCRKKWESIKEVDSIIHIYGHSDGAAIYLWDPNDGQYSPVKHRLDVWKFEQQFEKAGCNSATVCILNGCRTNAGPSGGGFFIVTAGPGFQGFIGTESQVSNEFAVKYAEAFLSLLLIHGRSIGEAYEELRVQLFPQSMFYSCYAHPDYRVG